MQLLARVFVLAMLLQATAFSPQLYAQSTKAQNPASPKLPYEKAPTMEVLPNGITLIHKKTTANDIVSLALVLEPGALFDDEDKPGLTSLMMRVITKGTERKNSFEIAEELQENGLRLSVSPGYDFLSFSLQAVKTDFPKGMELLEEIMLTPTFPVPEIELEKQRVLSEIRMREDRAPSSAMRRLREAMFSPSRYAKPLEGTEESLPLLTQRDLVTTWKERLRPERMTISVVGNLDFAEIKALVIKHFGKLELVSAAKAKHGLSQYSAAKLETVSRDVEQSFIAIGVRTCPTNHEDAAAVDVATALLGGGMSSRLFSRLRDERGLAYSVGAQNGGHLGVGYMTLFIGTSPEKACESLNGLWSEAQELRETPVSADELERAKSYLLGGYLRGHEKNSSQAWYLARWHVLELGTEYDSLYPQQVQAVTTRDVMRVANKYFVNPATVLIHPNISELKCLNDPNALISN
ncbi:MAG: M16 family metallopeptidase [Sumerlaeia bacterium]